MDGRVCSNRISTIRSGQQNYLAAGKAASQDRREPPWRCTISQKLVLESCWSNRARSILKARILATTVGCLCFSPPCPWQMPTEAAKALASSRRSADKQAVGRACVQAASLSTSLLRIAGMRSPSATCHDESRRLSHVACNSSCQKIF